MKQFLCVGKGTKHFTWGASQVALVVKNLPANAGNPNLILGQKDPLKKGIATHSSILAWKIPWTEKPGGL